MAGAKVLCLFFSAVRPPGGRLDFTMVLRLPLAAGALFRGRGSSGGAKKIRRRTTAVQKARFRGFARLLKWTDPLNLCFWLKTSYITSSYNDNVKNMRGEYHESTERTRTARRRTRARRTRQRAGTALPGLWPRPLPFCAVSLPTDPVPVLSAALCSELSRLSTTRLLPIWRNGIHFAGGYRCRNARQSIRSFD